MESKLRIRLLFCTVIPVAYLKVVQEVHAGQQSAKYRARGVLAQAAVGRHHAEQLASVAERQDHVDIFGVLQRLRVTEFGEESSFSVQFSFSHLGILQYFLVQEVQSRRK